MKRQILRFLGICVFALMAVSCSKLKGPVVLMNLGGADFTVKNLSTGETISNNGIAIGGAGSSLYVSRGDELELVYNPPKEADDFSLTVDFSYFDSKKSVNRAPYTLTIGTNDVEPGQYYISCKVDYKSGSDSVLDTGSVSVEVGK